MQWTGLILARKESETNYINMVVVAQKKGVSFTPASLLAEKTPRINE